MRTKEELLKVSLPKWPQCLITGKTITEDQALEIIRRTDSFLCHLPYIRNKDEYAKWVADTLQIPCDYPCRDVSEVNYMYECYDRWSENFGCIDLEYLYNDWIVSNFIGGCYGWCHPDGTIEYHYNIGKWPTVKEVLDELETIASNFPFLELTCTLMDAEYCEDRKPVISYVVKDGKVTVTEPIDIEEAKLHYTEEEDKVIKEKFLHIIKNGYDHQIPKEVIESWTKFVE